MKKTLALENLRTNSWRTASARHDGARRLRRREFFGTASLACFAAATMVVAFMQLLFTEYGSEVNKYLTALSACLGALLLVLSLIEWGAANGARAMQLFRSAEELNDFQHRLAIELACEEEVSCRHLKELQTEYETLKARCPVNHEPIDDLYFRALKREEPEFVDQHGNPRIGRAAAIWIRFRWNWASVWYFALFWLLIVSAFTLAGWAGR